MTIKKCIRPFVEVILSVTLSAAGQLRHKSQTQLPEGQARDKNQTRCLELKNSFHENRGVSEFDVNPGVLIGDYSGGPAHPHTGRLMF